MNSKDSENTHMEHTHMIEDKEINRILLENELYIYENKTIDKIVSCTKNDIETQRQLMAKKNRIIKHYLSIINY